MIVPLFDERLVDWMTESRADPDRAAMAVARAAMHRAVDDARGARLASPQRHAAWHGWLRRSPAHASFEDGRVTMLRGSGAPVRRPRGGAVPRLTAAVALVLVVILGAGWQAPAGNPLHQVRLVHEAVSLAVSSDPAQLRLGYAEDRLHDATGEKDPSASLDEAAVLLHEAQGAVPKSSPLWPRLSNDEQTLAAERGRTIPQGALPQAGGTASKPAAPAAVVAPASAGDAEGSSAGWKTSAEEPTPRAATSASEEAGVSSTVPRGAGAPLTGPSGDAGARFPAARSAPAEH